MILRHRLNRSLQRFKLLLSAAFIVVGTLSPFGPQPLLAQANFYQGKTVRMIVGFQAGDNHDLWMRFYARFLGKQIPGNPDFFVQNMPGAGGMIAANQLYNLTKPDGLTLATVGGALFMAQLTGRKEVQFDWPKFSWIMSWSSAI